MNNNNTHKTVSGRVLALSVASACLMLAACDNSNDAPDLDAPLSSLVTAASLTGDPTTGRTLPSIDDAKA